MIMTKVCTTCKQEKPETEFGKHKLGKSGINPRCKKCHAGDRRRLKHGIGVKDFQELALRQQNRCAICDLEKKLYLDHNHSTGNIRGLLCLNCNTGIGSLKDNPDILERARDYILSGGIL